MDFKLCNIPSMIILNSVGIFEDQGSRVFQKIQVSLKHTLAGFDFVASVPIARRKISPVPSIKPLCCKHKYLIIHPRKIRDSQPRMTTSSCFCYGSSLFPTNSNTQHQLQNPTSSIPETTLSTPRNLSTSCSITKHCLQVQNGKLRNPGFSRSQGVHLPRAYPTPRYYKGYRTLPSRILKNTPFHRHTSTPNKAALRKCRLRNWTPISRTATSAKHFGVTKDKG